MLVEKENDDGTAVGELAVFTKRFGVNQKEENVLEGEIDNWKVFDDQRINVKFRFCKMASMSRYSGSSPTIIPNFVDDASFSFASF